MVVENRRSHPQTGFNMSDSSHNKHITVQFLDRSLSVFRHEDSMHTVSFSLLFNTLHSFPFRECVKNRNQGFSTVLEHKFFKKEILRKGTDSSGSEVQRFCNAFKNTTVMQP